MTGTKPVQVHIAYKSSYGEDGFNVALFDVSDAKLMMCGLHTVKKMRVELSMSDNPYYMEEGGVYRNVIADIRPIPEDKQNGGDE